MDNNKKYDPNKSLKIPADEYPLFEQQYREFLIGLYALLSSYEIGINFDNKS